MKKLFGMLDNVWLFVDFAMKKLFGMFDRHIWSFVDFARYIRICDIVLFLVKFVGYFSIIYIILHFVVKYW